jgi:predicted RNA-binding protein associated with RNAse of E/G family
MSKLTTKQRNDLPDSAFALPGRKYLIVDESHARNALARASEGLHKGWITKADYDTIVRKAHSVLGTKEEEHG